jgi:VanZ family protein
MPSLNDALHHARFRPHWRVLLLLMLVLTSWFAFSPQPPGFQFKDSDKVNHLLAFSSLTLVCGLGMAPLRSRSVFTLAAMLLFAVFIELVQSQLPTRSADALDVLADGVGIAGGLLLLWGLRRVGAKLPG